MKFSFEYIYDILNGIFLSPNNIKIQSKPIEQKEFNYFKRKTSQFSLQKDNKSRNGVLIAY